MSQTSFYRRIAPSVMLVVALGIPALLYGVRGALQNGNNDVRQWLPSGFQETIEYDWFLKHFGSEEMALVSWPGATVDDPRLARLAKGLEPYVGEESSDSTSHSPKLFKRVTSTSAAVADLTSPPLRLSREQALQRLSGVLVGPDGNTGGVLIMVNAFGAKHRKQALNTVYAVAERVADVSPSDVHIGGPTADSVALDSESQRSRYLLTACSITIALGLAWRCLRQLRLVLIVFATAVLSALTSIAIVYYCGDTMNLLLVMMPTLVYLATMSASVHIVNYYRDALSEGHTEDAPAMAARMAVWPCILCTLTTAIGLGSLAMSDVVPVRMFGTYSALGILTALPVTFLFLPSALQLWPLKSPQTRQRGAEGDVAADASPTRAVGGWIARHHALVTLCGAALMAFTAFGVAQLTTSVKLLNLFSPQSRIIRDYTWLEEQMGPLVPIEIVLTFAKDSPSTMLDRLELVKRVEGELQKIDKVGGTMSAATFVPALPSGGGARQVVRRVMFDRRLAENRDYLQDVHYLRDAEDGELWRVSARVEALNSIDYGFFIDQIQNRVQPVLDQALHSGHGRVDATFTGIVPLVYKSQRTLLQDLVSSFMSAFIIIAVIMMLLLRSVAAGFVSMIPNLFPAVTVFGAMGLAGMLCDIGSMMTAGVALGIAVDDTIHYLSWFRRGLDRGLSRHEAIVLAYQRCAKAMIQSSLICGLGLLVFSFSEFVPTSRFAWLMATMLVSALIGDLLVLPAILAGPLGRLFERRRVSQSVVHVEEPVVSTQQLPALG